jgi:class 3 adenylate cyclase
MVGTKTDASQVAWSQQPDLTPFAGNGHMRLSYHFVVAVDIEGFSRLSTLEQLHIQSDLERVLDAAAMRAGLDRKSWYRQVGGDGELAVLPRDTDSLRLVAHYPRELGYALAQINNERHPAPRVRIRVAMHHGTLVEGIFGPAGQAPIVVSRLLDSDALRQELAQYPEFDLALAVSASLYTEIIETQLGGLNPAEYRRLRICIKGVEYDAYMHRGSKLELREAPFLRESTTNWTTERPSGVLVDPKEIGFPSD